MSYNHDNTKDKEDKKSMQNIYCLLVIERGPQTLLVWVGMVSMMMVYSLF